MVCGYASVGKPPDTHVPHVEHEPRPFGGAGGFHGYRAAYLRLSLNYRRIYRGVVCYVYAAAQG